MGKDFIDVVDALTNRHLNVPLCGEVLWLLYVFNDVLIQSFMPDRAVIALDVSVLLQLGPFLLCD